MDTGGRSLGIICPFLRLSNTFRFDERVKHSLNYSFKNAPGYSHSKNRIMILFDLFFRLFHQLHLFSISMD